MQRNFTMRPIKDLRKIVIKIVSKNERMKYMNYAILFFYF